MDINSKKGKTVIGIIALLFGLLGVPPLLQYFYGVSAISTAFVIIIIYAGINFWMKRNSKESE